MRCVLLGRCVGVVVGGAGGPAHKRNGAALHVRDWRRSVTGLHWSVTGRIEYQILLNFLPSFLTLQISKDNGSYHYVGGKPAISWSCIFHHALASLTLV